MASKLSKALDNPGAALSVIAALAKGYFYKLWYPLRGVRFSAGRNFRVFGKLTVHGPGTVRFGDDVVVGMHVTPYTHDRDALIEVGNHCFLNGVRFGCKQHIAVGDHGILAEARIMDTNFHSTRADRWSPYAPITTRPIAIARNVWVAVDAAILPGTSIGENSVVALGAVCAGEYPKDSLIGGNPARVIREIEHPPAE